MWPLGGFFLASQLVLLEFRFSLLVMHFCLENPVVGTLIHLRLTLSSLEIPYKNKPPDIKTIFEAKEVQAQNSYGDFFTFFLNKCVWLLMF